MRFYNGQHTHYCGIDLHAATLYVCILDPAGEICVHRNAKSNPGAFLDFIAPYRDDSVVAAEYTFTRYWLADLCAKESIPFVLGHTLAMRAIRGGKTKNDKLDSHEIAVRLRGGMLPQAYVYPAAMRATRDLLRRRLHFVRKRGQLLAHIQNTLHPCNLDPFGKRSAYPANREGLLEHFPDPAVRQERRGRPRAARALRHADRRSRAQHRGAHQAPRRRRLPSSALGTRHRAGSSR